MKPSTTVFRLIFRFLPLVAAGLVLPSIPAMAQESDPLVFVMDCPGIPHNGAGTVDVRLDNEGNATLRGLVGDKVIWSKPVPLPDPVNTPKTSVACNGAKIIFSSQFPGSASTKITTFLWDGEHLKLTGETMSDPSAEAVEKIITAAEEGDEESFRKFTSEEGEADIFYPHRYIDAGVLGGALSRGQKAAAAIAKKGKPDEAAQRLALMFEATVFLGTRVEGAEFPESTPERWLVMWKTLKVPVGGYIGPFNDYGFYLQQARQHGEAVRIFKEVLRLSPGRMVTFLNLADSQWEMGFFEEAKANYQKYQALMFDRGRTRAVPVRVIQRLGKG